MRIAELRKLPNVEKLRIVETLRADLTSDESVIESPAWHEATLQETAEDYVAGRLVPLDWETARSELRSRFE
jgi:hypothetical protein